MKKVLFSVSIHNLIERKPFFCSEVKSQLFNYYFDATISAYVAAQLITAQSPKQTEFIWKPRGISRYVVKRSDWLGASGSGHVTWTHLAFWDTNSARYEKLDHSSATNVCVKRSGGNGSNAPARQRGRNELVWLVPGLIGRSVAREEATRRPAAALSEMHRWTLCRLAVFSSRAKAHGKLAVQGR